MAQLELPHGGLGFLHRAPAMINWNTQQISKNGYISVRAGNGSTLSDLTVKFIARLVVVFYSYFSIYYYVDRYRYS